MAHAFFVSIVLPVYNEKPALFSEVLQGISNQTRRPVRVWIVDDGSKETTCFDQAVEWAVSAKPLGIEVRLERFEENRGKREAQTVAFRGDPDAEIFVTLDSDSILEQNALEEVVRPFEDRSVMGVSALILGRNWKENLFTRLVDLEFVSTFLTGRAALGRSGSVLTTCGSLAAYRASVCRDNIDRYVGEVFLGVKIMDGDDRKLTQFALLQGAVVYQESAVARASIPGGLSELIRQRLRWSTTLVRGTLWMVRNMPIHRRPFFWTVVHIGMVFLPILVLVAAVVFGSRIGWGWIGLGYGIYLVPVSLLRRIRYARFQRPDMSRSDRLKNWLLSPVLTLLENLVLDPVRYLALFFLRSSSWRTR